MSNSKKNRRNKKRGEKTEKSFEKEFGARGTKASGAYNDDKGDGEIDRKFLYDSKHTDKKSYRITAKEIAKITSEASRANRIPALLIKIDGMNPLYGKDFVVLRKRDFKDLIGKNDED